MVEKDPEDENLTGENMGNTPVNYHSATMDREIKPHIKRINLTGLTDEELFGPDWLYEEPEIWTEKKELVSQSYSVVRAKNCYKCEMCNIKCETEIILKKHIKNEHKINIDLEPEYKTDDI